MRITAEGVSGLRRLSDKESAANEHRGETAAPIER